MTTPLKRRKPLYNKKCKFVDDLRMAKSIDFKSKLRKFVDDLRMAKSIDLKSKLRKANE